MKIKYSFIVLLAVLLLGTACNDEWKEEQYEHYIAFRSPLNNKGVTEIYIPYSRKSTDGNYLVGEGRSNYELPLIVSGSLPNEQNIKVHVAHDADTLETLNLARFQHRTDLFYQDMGVEDLGFVTFPETVDFRSGEDVSLLDINFDFRGIDMSKKWVLPLTVVDNPSYGYESHPRKNYAKAILRILPFNDFSGVYSGTALMNFVKGEEGSGSIVANDITGYVVDENTIFFYAGTINEDRTDRANYKVFAKFSGGETGGVINFYTENPSLNFVNKKEASYRILEEMDAVRPYLKRRYVIINNIDYEYTDYTSVPGSGIVYTVRGSLTLERIFNTQIPDEDQAIEW
ncbi:MAG: DUF4973 domain-containing protein [Fermentimonas sp.]|nr:DUF4973 domain-containing protein [Dysgonamonadaceae bacterium]MDD4698069.1 DUF4973 domain-containing protein [Fermentimonas sp.]